MAVSLSRIPSRRYHLTPPGPLHVEGLEGSVLMAMVLHVCLANRARSALAETITRQLLAARGVTPSEIMVGSAGVRARPDAGWWPEAESEALRRGLPTAGFAARPLTPQLLAEAELVLTATRALRDEVVATAPRVLPRTFTWRELAWLLDGVCAGGLPDADAAQRFAAIPALARAQRGRRAAPAPQALDVEDPVSRESGFVHVVADQITEATSTWVDLL